jgi:hypothetical protein
VSAPASGKRGLAAERSVPAGGRATLTRAVPTGWVAESLVVGGLMLFAAVVHLLLARRVAAPWILVDELIYSELAKSFAAGGHFLVRGHPSDAFTLYSALIAPAYLAKSVGTAYGLAKAINVLLMTLAAVPVYLWARRLVPIGLAIVATALTLLLPGLLYSGVIMTENAFFPAFLLAAYLLALTLERPTLLRQLLTLAAIALATGIRTQGVVLLLVLPTAILFKVFLDLRAEPAPWRAGLQRLRPFVPTFAVLVLGAAAYLVRSLINGTSVEHGLGGYAVVAQTDYSAAEAGRWIVYHLGELFYSVGYLPAAALIVLLGLACRSRAPAGPAERAFLATTAAALLWVVPQVALFASRFALRVEERNMFVLSPLLLLALVVWIARGMARPYGLSLVALVLPAALFSTLPLERFFNISVLSDTFGFIPLYRLSQLASGGTDDVRIALAGGFIAGAVLFALVPKHLARVLVPAAVAGFLLLSSISVSNTIAAESRLIRATAGTNPNWIDDAIGPDAEAAFLFAGDATSNPHLLWQAEFWNRSLKRVVAPGTDEPGSLFTEPVQVDVDGRISPATGTFRSPRFLVADPKFDVDGTVVATSNTGLALYRLRDPLRLASTTDGITADGWSGSTATYTRFTSPSNRPGTLAVVVSRKLWSGPDAPGRVRVIVGPLVRGPAGPELGKVTTLRTWVVHSGGERTFRLRTPPPPFRAEVQIEPTFSPSTYGSADTRQLGAQVRFEFLSR